MRKVLTPETINPNLIRAEYAVRGELPIISETLRARLLKAEKDGTPHGLPFDQVISANIGNPQQLGQKPLTFFRQVASLLENPELLKQEPLLAQLGYKSDVIARAHHLLEAVGSVGAYSPSMGAPAIRATVADFLERRDGYPADPERIFLTGGASAGVSAMLSTICASSNTGILVPIPQYPLYTATLAVMGARCVPYYLDEESGWSTSLDSIRTALDKARKEGVDVRAVVIINPGNPTGSSLAPEDIREVIRFAAREHLVVMADEVYQTNVFQGQFHSFKKALRDLEAKGEATGVELVSLHSVSKGMVGECGHRAGYFELVNFDDKVFEQVYKFVSIMLCSPVLGQCYIDMMVNPPKKGDPSFELYDKEYNSIYNGLKQRAEALHAAFERMEGIECQQPMGAMYLFPTLRLSQKAIAQAKAENRTADSLWCKRLLEATGICVVPGSGFGQKEGTLHFRTTFLAPGTEWIDRMVKFHEGFIAEFGKP